MTDRFSSHFENLSAGEYQLAIFDVASGQIRPVRTFDEGKSINPQWNADGRRVYFVSDRDGISNVYVVNVDSGALGQVTNVDAGVSGITALSPTISSAMDARELALSAYENGSYHVYLVNTAEALAGRPLTMRARDAALADANVRVALADSQSQIIAEPSYTLASVAPDARVPPAEPLDDCPAKEACIDQ